MKRILVGLPAALALSVVTAIAASSAAASVVTVPIHSGTYSGGGTTDSHVQIVLDSHGGTVPRQAYNVDPQSSYYYQPLANPNTNYIAPYWDVFGSARYGEAGANTNYQTQFLLPLNAANPSVTMQVATDNQTTAIRLNGGPSFGSQPYPCPSDTSNFSSLSGPFTRTNGFVKGGTNALTFETVNCEAFGFGALYFNGSLSYTPTSFNAGQCQNGGYSSLVDSSGTVFSTQDACTAAATGKH